MLLVVFLILVEYGEKNFLSISGVKPEVLGLTIQSFEQALNQKAYLVSCSAKLVMVG